MMGHHAVIAVTDQYRGLSADAQRVLILMARVCLDPEQVIEGQTPDAHLYFGGWWWLAKNTVEYDVPEFEARADAPPEVKLRVQRVRKKARNRITKAIKELKDQGAIKVVKEASPGNRAHYEISVIRALQPW